MEKIKKILNNYSLTAEQIKYILDFIVNKTITKISIKDSTTRDCKESSIFVNSLCNRLDIPYIPFSFSELNMNELEHHFGIAGFNTNIGQVCVLLDLTYIQFTEETYPVVNKKNMRSVDVLSPVNFVDYSIVSSLVKSGYITLTKENFYEYINGFISSYKLVNQINENDVYNKLFNLFDKFDINFIEYDYLNNTVKKVK